MALLANHPSEHQLVVLTTSLLTGYTTQQVSLVHDRFNLHLAVLQGLWLYRLYFIFAVRFQKWTEKT